MRSEDTPEEVVEDLAAVPSIQVIEAVAAREGVDPVELDVLLAEVIDPEALDDLFVSGTATLTFEYHGYTVTVHGDGQVDVSEGSGS